MDSERLSFEEASRELGVSEEELEQLVAAGEIASVKDGDTIFFKKAVVQKFKKNRESGTANILLADDEIDLLGDELELDVAEETAPAEKTPAAADSLHKDEDGRIEISLDDDLGLEDLELAETPATDEGQGKAPAAGAKKAKAPAEISDDETLLNLDGLLEEDSEGTTPVPVGGADDTLLDTDDILDLDGLGGESDPFDSDTVEETSVTDLTEPGTLLRGGGARVMQMKRKKSHAGWTVALALSAVLLILPVGIMTNMLFAHSPQTQEGGLPPAESYSWILEYNVLDGLIEAIADVFRS